MAAISELKDRIDTKTMHLVLLTFATYGLYPIMWLFRYSQAIAEISKTRIVDNSYMIWMAACYGWGIVFSFMAEQRGMSSSDSEVIAAIGGMLMIANSVLYIVWAFKAKAALENYALTQFKIDLRMNGFYTFLFSIFYINYCMEDLPEAQRKHQVMMSNFQQGEKQNSNPNQQG
jgi:hypothetical protein